MRWRIGSSANRERGWLREIVGQASGPPLHFTDVTGRSKTQWRERRVQMNDPNGNLATG